MIYGIGYISAQSTDKLFSNCPAQVTFSSEISNILGTAFNLDGVRQVTSSNINGEKYTVNLTFEQVDWTTLQLAYGTESFLETNNVPITENFSSGPFTLTYTPIPGEPIYYTDLLTGQEIIPSTDAQSYPTPFSVRYRTNGSPGVDELSQINTLDNIKLTVQLVGVGDSYILVANNAFRISYPRLEIRGGKTVVSVDYRLGLGSKADRKPFRVYSVTSSLAPTIPDNALLDQNSEPIVTENDEFILT